VSTQAVRSASFRLFGVDVLCHVLEDGRRVIAEESVHALFAAMAGDKAADVADDAEVAAFARWMRGQA